MKAHTKFLGIWGVLVVFSMVWAAFLPAWNERPDKLIRAKVSADAEVIKKAVDLYCEQSPSNGFPPNLDDLSLLVSREKLASSNEWREICEQFLYIRPNLSRKESFGRLILIEKTNRYRHINGSVILQVGWPPYWTADLELLENLRKGYR